LAGTIDVAVAQVQGVWAPEKISEKRFGAGPDSPPTYVAEVKLLNLQVNAPLPKEMFSLEFLKLPKEALLIRTAADGRPAILKAAGGLWIEDEALADGK
jgi:hypothetical protein